MNASKLFFKENGYLVLEHVLFSNDLLTINQQLQTIDMSLAGNRELLSEQWCQNLANQLKKHSVLATILPEDPIAIQCTFFQKTLEKNWLVPLHQDLSIPLKKQVDLSGFTGWSEKQGYLFAQPPSSVLKQIVAIRLHIDDCHQEHGPLKVVPNSHKDGRISERYWTAIRNKKGEVLCTVNAGGAVIMSPLTLHSSSKAMTANNRRVLHFLFVPNQLTTEIPFLNTV